MQSLLPPLLSSCPCCQPASSSCPVICLPAPHIPLRALSWDPPHPGCKLHTCLSADPPCPLTALLRASVLPPQLPLLFPFFSGALLVFLHPRSRQPPSAQPVAPSDLLRVVVPLFLCLSSLVSPPPAQVLPVPGCHPRGPCPGMCSRPLSPVQLPSLVLFLPCCFLLQMVLSLLLATHQLHPHHLSKSFAYSLLITFPSSLQKLPVPRAGSCFRVSLTAVMRILFPQVAFGVPVITPFSLGIPQALFPWGLAFTSLGPPVSHCECLASLLGLSPARQRCPFSPPQELNTTCCSALFPASLHCPGLSLSPATQTVVPACLFPPGSATFHSILLLALLPSSFSALAPSALLCLLIRIALPCPY